MAIFPLHKTYFTIKLKSGEAFNFGPNSSDNNVLSITNEMSKYFKVSDHVVNQKSKPQTRKYLC